MLRASLVGLGDLTYGSQFSCNTSYCWGLGGEDLTFRQLQHVANKLAEAKGLTKITVDGFIGKDTTRLIAQIAATEPTILAFLGGMASQVTPTARQVASQADRLVQAMLAIPSVAAGTPSGSPPSPSQTIPGLPTTTGSAVATTTNPLPSGLPGANTPVVAATDPFAAFLPASVVRSLPKAISPTLLFLAGGGLLALILLKKRK